MSLKNFASINCPLKRLRITQMLLVNMKMKTDVSSSETFNSGLKEGHAFSPVVYGTIFTFIINTCWGHQPMVSNSKPHRLILRSTNISDEQPPFLFTRNKSVWKNRILTYINNIAIRRRSV